MQERGTLVRDVGRKAVAEMLQNAPVGPYKDMDVEASDGTGLKARVPWIRVFSRSRSPSATRGWYLVYLFAADGSAVYLSLNQGTTIAEAGYRNRPTEFLQQRVRWALEALAGRMPVSSRTVSSIDLRDSGALASGYEAGNVVAKRYPVDAIPNDDELSADLDQMLNSLLDLYASEAFELRKRRGYEAGGPLERFSDPLPLVGHNVAEVPDTSGVHVVWDSDGELLYVGESNSQRERLRQHLRNRTSSILFEKVARLLSERLSREAKDHEVKSFLQNCDFAWREADNAGKLKARLIDELHPRMNDVRPNVDVSPASQAIAVYVGERASGNFRVGLEARTWGWKEDRDDYAEVKPSDWLVMGSGYTGGSVRVSEEDWRRHRLGRVLLGRVTTSVYEDPTPLWPDEQSGDASYPYRLQFETVKELRDVSLGSDSPLGADVVEALRKSACVRGIGHLVPAKGAAFESLPEEDTVGLDQICQQFATDLLDANLDFGSEHAAFVRTFVASLATKRLVLLTGLSGSGKTRIALALGQWFGPANRLLVPVRPDWTGPDVLLGYEDALQRAADGTPAWHVPEVLAFMLRAARDQRSPYLLVLDEMNLAHVERYFADVLSGMESDEGVLPNVERDVDGVWRVVGDPLAFPSNLFVAGTVNVDETTYMFSPKVLDRANTIEFRVAASDLAVDALRPSTVASAARNFTRSFLAVAEDESFQNDRPASNRDALAEKMRDLHGALAPYGFEFGHRVFFEAIRFAALLEAAGATDQWEALDLQVKQKILPRLHGSIRRLNEPLRLVGRFCFDLSVPTPGEGQGPERFDPEAPSDGEPVLPQSFDKVRRMTRSLRANQFASFSE